MLRREQETTNKLSYESKAKKLHIPDKRHCSPWRIADHVLVPGFSDVRRHRDHFRPSQVAFDYHNGHRRDSHDSFLLHDYSSGGVPLNRRTGQQINRRQFPKTAGKPAAALLPDVAGKDLVPTPMDML